ncbi:hypothetical protein JM16_001270 [Phytophthora kernoviae]|uniref:RING-type domain-containing protein n=1 Tax=Phytophthora kernoviae TaxID=325452 RepID=A0A8T0M9J3_9STRA|nr:hypothetical protein JM16_001270 [Phytophthora kernoviae]
MGNESSKHQQSCRNVRFDTQTGPRPIAGRSDVLTQMIPDQFTSLPQVTVLYFLDEDNIIPVYGFGDELTCDRAVFTLAKDEGQAGFPLENIRSRYRDIVSNVVMAGPTSFAPIINQAVNIVNRTGDYHILVIIADGQVTRSVDIPPHAVSKNEKETIDAITYASNFPLSIVMVGVGDGPWESMIYFDNYLVHRKFDNFQFIEYHKITSQFSDQQMKETQFALQALMEIPDQYRTIKAMKYLDQGPNRVRADLPRVDVFPSPQPMENAQNNFGVYQPRVQQIHQVVTTTQISQPAEVSPSAPLFGSTDDTRSGLVRPPLQHRSSRAEDELARLQETLTCPICEERKKDTVFQCGHETCQKCGEILSHCPLCRQEIQVRIKRFG